MPLEEDKSVPETEPYQQIREYAVVSREAPELRTAEGEKCCRGYAFAAASRCFTRLRENVVMRRSYAVSATWWKKRQREAPAGTRDDMIAAYI